MSKNTPLKKVLVLNGSPRPVSDTMAMTNAFLKGLSSRDFEIETIRLIDKKIAPCLGCFGCWAKADGHCVQNDDQNAILDAIAAADVILWSFPLYCYSMPSHVKAVIDRLLPFNTPKMVEENGRVRHVNLVDFSQKTFLVFSGCGFPSFEKNFEPLRQMCRNLFGDPIMVFMPEAPMMNVPEAQIVALSKKAAFTRAGREFAKTGTLSGQTVARLEAPMISAEQYMAIVNSGK